MHNTGKRIIIISEYTFPARHLNPETLATVRRHPRISGYNSVRIDGLRAFESGTGTFGFAAPPRLGCRESNTPWSASEISILLSPPVALTFYSHVNVHTALPPNHPFSHLTSIVTLRYHVPGWFSFFTTYFRLLKTHVETDILHLADLRSFNRRSAKKRLSQA